MNYIIYFKSGKDRIITEKQFKALTANIATKDRQFIVYDEHENIEAVIFTDHIESIEVDK